MKIVAKEQCESKKKRKTTTCFFNNIYETRI